MTISAKILADSVGPLGLRLTTFELRYPRFIHSELMTHRVLSKSSASSRAIPIKKLIKDIRRDPAMPVHWGAKQKGMQADFELPEWKIAIVKFLWLTAMWIATTIALVMESLGLHKQVANRIVEPWAHMTVVVTGTDWINFYNLRCHKDAQPEFRRLAWAMLWAARWSKPKQLLEGEWHLPYIDQTVEEIDPGYFIAGPVPESLKGRMVRSSLPPVVFVSAARCARTSYKTMDGRVAPLAEELKLFERLMGSVPLHASPAEHVAMACGDRFPWGPLRGFRSLRMMLHDENPEHNFLTLNDWFNQLPTEYFS